MVNTFHVRVLQQIFEQRLREHYKPNVFEISEAYECPKLLTISTNLQKLLPATELGYEEPSKYNLRVMHYGRYMNEHFGSYTNAQPIPSQINKINIYQFGVKAYLLKKYIVIYDNFHTNLSNKQYNVSII